MFRLSFFLFRVLSEGKSLTALFRHVRIL